MFRKLLLLIASTLFVASAWAGDWYTASGVPSTGSQGSSAAMRGEFNLINTAMDKLPTVTANGLKGVFVNSGGTALESVTAATARTNLGLVLGTDAQAWDDDLDDLAALVPTDSNFIVGNGTDWIAETGATARTSLGLGSIATQAASSVAITGGTIDGAVIGGSTPAAITGTALTATGAFTSLGIDDNATSTAITIDANKNVSIGIVSSAGRLSLYEAGAATKPLHVFAGSNDAGTKTSITLGSFTTGAGGSEIRSETYHSGNTQSTLEFLTTGAERMRIDASGNVGIGTPTPKVPLNVVDDAADTNYPTLGAASGIHAIANASNEFGLLMGVKSDSGASWLQAQRLSGAATAYDLVLQPSGGSVTIPDVDITGGSIDGATVGAATPSSGAFTTGAFSGAVTSTKACDSGYTRLSPNYCSVTDFPTYTSLTRDACTTITMPTDAKGLLLGALLKIGAAGSIELRETNIRAYRDSSCIFKVGEVGGTAQERSSHISGDAMVSLRDRLHGTGTALYIKFTDDSGDQGSGQYGILGYYD